MSGKFMKVKKIVIPIISLVIMASQLMGCAAATESELLQMLNQGEAIEIEVMAPINEEQGQQKELSWEALDKLSTYSDFRKTFDDELKIVRASNGSKNGVAYINLDGQQEGNNTLFNAFQNRKFISTYWENEKVQDAVQDAVLEVYSDVEEETKAIQYAAINAYWNILPDSEPSYFNGNSTLTRGEFLTAVMRAETPVTESGTPESNSSFASAVGKSEYTDFASYISKDSYLDTTSKSLDNMTFNGTITRAEAIYTIVNHYFANEFKNADIKKSISFEDCKNGGNIAQKQKFIDSENTKEHWKSYELTYAIQNPDNGCPETLYKAMVVASDLNLINGSESRWDEGITKTETLELITKAYEAYAKLNGYKVDATSGIINNPVNSEETNEKSTEEYYAPVETPEEAEYQNYLDEEAHQEAETPKETTANDELTDITPLDKTMYAKGNINTRTGPSTEYTKAGNLTLNESVHVTGQSQSTAWYQLTLPSGEVVYCSNQLLSDTKTEPQQQTNNNSNNQQTNNANNQNQQPSNNTTPVQDTPSTETPSGGMEQGNLGGDNGFAGIDYNDDGAWDGIGDNTPAH